MFKFAGKKFKDSVIARSFSVIPQKNRRKLIFATLLQVGLSILDLIGVAIIGILGALSVTGIQSQQPGFRVSKVLKMLQIDNFDFQIQAAILGGTATVFLVLRTILSIFITRKILFFLSRQGAVISTNLLNRLLGQSLLQIQARSTQETVYSLTAGISSITLGVLATFVSIIADGSLLIILVAALFAVDSLIAITSVIFFGLMGVVLYRTMNLRAQELGLINSQQSVVSNQKIIEILDSYRESLVRNTRQYYSREISKTRHQLADVLAEIQFMPSVSKYVIESGMVIGAVLIAGAQFALQDARHAVATLSVFLAAGTRIAPAILRLQQNLIQIRAATGSATPTLVLIGDLTNSVPLPDKNVILDRRHKGFKAEVTLSNVSFRYPENKSDSLKKISLKIKPGSSLAIVGPSGAGKTTLVDVLLGILNPNFGTITVSGKAPREAIDYWPGAIAYVPQDVSIINGTLRENVALGFPGDLQSDDFVRDSLKLAQLENFVAQLPNGLDTQVGERGTKLSGGQRQRLGIARALFTNPRLLVLDEATSSLDGQTESELSEAIRALHGQVTVVLIAHRLSTVKNSDQVLYVRDGAMIALGSFDEVRNRVPEFDTQVKLIGL